MLGLNLITQSIFEFESRNQNVEVQMNRQNYTNFDSNLAMVVFHLPVKFEFDWTKRLRIRVEKWKC